MLWCGEAKADAGSFSRLALELGEATRLSRKAEHLTQAQPAASSDGFGSEKWFKYPDLLVHLNACAVILDA